jgi:drug/metabolite transporter (DMT)-like permease
MIKPQATILTALLAAVLFGVSTPAAKSLVQGMHPVLLAGLLYLGSGIGLTLVITARAFKPSIKEHREASLKQNDMPWLGGAIAFGGVIGPALLMLGLQTTPASEASLLLNLEGVLTALLAWFAFHENVDRRVALGMFAIISGSIVLSIGPSLSYHLSFSSLLIAGACLCWAIDNNLTRKISQADPLQIAALKGICAGFSNCSIALFAGQELPPLPLIMAASMVGFFGYGISLTLYIQALRGLGTARTSAYFSVAPFVGAAVAILILRESPTPQLVLSGILMAVGVWLHITEHHEHQHVHEPIEHEHMHVHDEHHQHEHDQSIELSEPHSHPHRHERLVHSHPHYPDMHHDHHH